MYHIVLARNVCTVIGPCNDQTRDVTCNATRLDAARSLIASLLSTMQKSSRKQEEEVQVYSDLKHPHRLSL
jgi:hypothetical protein